MSFTCLPHQLPLVHMMRAVTLIFIIIPKSSIYLLHTVLEKKEKRENLLLGSSMPINST